MRKTLKIDFVSDISCPWCVVGLGGLEAALERVGDLVDARITFQPFELNPNMPPEGQNIVEHVAQKYGATREQSAANRQAIPIAPPRWASPWPPMRTAASTTPSTLIACCTGRV